MSAVAVPTNDLIGGSNAGAIFSEARDYRYRLWRVWDERRPPLTWLMCNPSTADELVLDPTLKGCIRRAKEWGYGELWVVNVFALRSTDPRALYGHHDPVGPENDEHIAEVVDYTAKRGGIVIAGWGQHGKLHDRGEAVRLKMAEMGAVLHALHVNADGSPKHPLYVSMNTLPFVWRL